MTYILFIIIHQVVDYFKWYLIEKFLDIVVLHDISGTDALSFGFHLLQFWLKSLNSFVISADLLNSGRSFWNVTPGGKGVQVNFLDIKSPTVTVCLIIYFYLLILLIHMNHGGRVRKCWSIKLISWSDKLIRYLEDCRFLLLFLFSFFHMDRSLYHGFLNSSREISLCMIFHLSYNRMSIWFELWETVLVYDKRFLTNTVRSCRVLWVLFADGLASVLAQARKTSVILTSELFTCNSFKCGCSSTGWTPLWWGRNMALICKAQRWWRMHSICNCELFL